MQPIRLSVNVAPLDARAPADASPRLRGRFILALCAALVASVAALGVRLWNEHAHSEQQRAQIAEQRAYARANAEFIGAYRFPSEIVREPSSYWDLCSGGPCGHSALAPYELGARLGPTLGDGKIIGPALNPARCRTTPLCTVTVLGHFDGYTTVAIVFWHTIFARAPRRAPRGAIDYHHLGRLFLVGSDVSVGLTPPSSLAQ